MLFLSLSSHGSKDGEISVRNGMLALNDLSASDLAAALRESGIKWKVIVVSACYAGKFIEPLRDDNTIIIAAAAADRTSFGCSDDREPHLLWGSVLSRCAAGRIGSEDGLRESLRGNCSP